MIMKYGIRWIVIFVLLVVCFTYGGEYLSRLFNNDFFGDEIFTICVFGFSGVLSTQFIAIRHFNRALKKIGRPPQTTIRYRIKK